MTTATTTVPVEQTIADLRAAATLQRQRGWTPGRYIDPITDCVCTLGAIHVAITGNAVAPGRDVAGSLRARVRAAEGAVDRYLREYDLLDRDDVDEVDPRRWTTSWSDTVCKSTEESAGLLDAVAAELASTLDAS